MKHGIIPSEETLCFFPLRVGAYNSVVYIFTSNRRFITFLLICCRLFSGPIAGGYLSSALGFEWAATVLSFTGLFIVSVCFLHSQNIKYEDHASNALKSQLPTISASCITTKTRLLVTVLYDLPTCSISTTVDVYPVCNLSSRCLCGFCTSRHEVVARTELTRSRQCCKIRQTDFTMIDVL